jgi:MarR family transcriptional regulator for hemolysin
MQDARKLFLGSRRYHEAGSREDLNFQFTSAVMALGRRWRNRLNEELATIGQTQARWESLFWIEIAKGQATQRELAQRVGIEGPTFARMLDRLEKERLVERRVSKWDRRTKTIALCKGATPRLKQISDLTDRLRTRLLADVEPEELAACIAVVRLILAKLQTL